MRGKVTWEYDASEMAGITPAYAGKSCRNANGQRVDKDHPRLCGEKRIVQRYFVHSAGSPPPMRGKAWLLYHRGELFRITPAYAGKR